MIHLLVYSSPYPDKRGLRNEKLRDQTTTHRRVHSTQNLILILLYFSHKPNKTQQLSCKQTPVICPHHPLFFHPVHFHLINLSHYMSLIVKTLRVLAVWLWPFHCWVISMNFIAPYWWSVVITILKKRHDLNQGINKIWALTEHYLCS